MKTNLRLWTRCTLTALFLLVISSCVSQRYDFIGHWTQKAGTLTYVNEDQHMVVTFPNDQWRVYTEPASDYLKVIWTAPTKHRPAYHVMHAELTELAMNAQIEVEPVSEDIDLQFYIDIHRHRLETVRGIQILSNYVTTCADRSMGLTVLKGTSETGGARGMKIITGTFKEKGRFTLLTLACPESLFESGKEQFWAIADAYEYIE